MLSLIVGNGFFFAEAMYRAASLTGIIARRWGFTTRTDLSATIRRTVE
jgi:hypothetical protein